MVLQGPTVGLPAMRIERGCAVRAHDLQVLEPVVIGHAVDVVKDQRHAAALPFLALAAQLARPCLEPGVVEPLLEVLPLIGGAGHEHVSQWDPFAMARRGRADEMRG
jgi:hypothetical protein